MKVSSVQPTNQTKLRVFLIIVEQHAVDYRDA